ncbi:hypothetical protein BDW22DRAFT_1324081, partial [Trametopsis cervina]
MSNDYTDNHYVKAHVPLSFLIKKLSIRMLYEVARNHGIAISKGRNSKDGIITKMTAHTCISCSKYICVFQPRLSPVRAHENTRTALEVESKLQRGRDACKKWRKKRQFPPKPASVSHVHNIIQGFTKDSAFEQINETGCAVCGCLVLCSELQDIQSLNVDVKLLYNPNVTRKERLSYLDPIETLTGPRGVMPKNALANGLWIGDTPNELQGLSWMEQKLIARIATNYCVVRVHSSGLYKMRTNVVCRATPMKKIYNVLPPKRTDFEEVLAILFIGPAPPTPVEFKRTPLLVRRDKVWDALQWLRLNHTDYIDIELSQDNLNEYSEDEPPVIVDYHPTSNE